MILHPWRKKNLEDIFFLALIENLRIQEFTYPRRSKRSHNSRKLAPTNLHDYTVFYLLRNFCFITGPGVGKQFGMDFPLQTVMETVQTVCVH